MALHGEVNKREERLLSMEMVDQTSEVDVFDLANRFMEENVYF
jgi:hypothetical protein